MTYVCNVAGIFVSSTSMAITSKVNVAVGFVFGAYIHR